MTDAATPPAPAPAPSPAAPPASAPPASPPADQGAPAPSALSSVAANEWTPEAIPEKFRVLGEDGQLDPLATMRKVDEHRSALEKRMGAGDIRPKSADDYKLPDTETFKSLKLDDAASKGFRDKAHAAGFSQAQYEFAMNQWAELAPQLVNAGKTETFDGAVADLKKHWGDAFASEMQGAYKAVQGVAEKAGLGYEEVDAAIGNNQVAIRLFAALSKEMNEDATPAAANGGTGGAQSRSEYVAANWAAYSNPQDPQHATVTARAAQMAAREKGAQEPIA